MPFIPHTSSEIEAMLETIDAASIDALFDEIPKDLIAQPFAHIPDGNNEMLVDRLLQQRADQVESLQCYAGAGAYQHHIPAAVWDIAMRGEFLTAYTPYQAEASQGTLQLLYEFQTMIAKLTGMEVANASLYDGATSLAEAILMAVRVNKKRPKRILLIGSVHPYYRQVVQTIVSQQQIELVDIPVESATGVYAAEQLTAYEKTEFAAVVVQQPNFLGCLHATDTITDWAHAHDALLIACVNPMAMALCQEPGQWGDTGADIVCGDLQPLGIPLAFGGPYAGFLTARKTFARQMPGRIVGRTQDLDGKTGFCLTLQAREQHIRRSKATSNICTNQGLLVTAVTIYLSLLGDTGLRQVAQTCHQQATALLQKITAINGVQRIGDAPFFHEFAVSLPKPVDRVLTELAQRGIQGGVSLTAMDPSWPDGLLICVTETKTMDDITQYAAQLAEVLA
ncbi:MAG: aminomethyl-transferring glycine dehydrogenase subunit GcvPA [Legionellales bacterium]|nr:aminomethyl-transferring glycine dehydrogenase subunit GcvPA [Legionellales bacterium]